MSKVDKISDLKFAVVCSSNMNRWGLNHKYWKHFSWAISFWYELLPAAFSHKCNTDPQSFHADPDPEADPSLTNLFFKKLNKLEFSLIIYLYGTWIRLQPTTVLFENNLEKIKNY